MEEIQNVTIDGEQVDLEIRQRKEPEDAQMIKDAINEKLKDIQPKTSSEQIEGNEEDFLDDLNVLHDIYKQHNPWSPDCNVESYPELCLKTNIMTACEQMIRTNMTQFRVALEHLMHNGTATYKNQDLALTEIKKQIDEEGLINFLDRYVDGFINMVNAEIKQKGTEITPQLNITIFVSCYVTALVDCILARHNSMSLSKLTVTNEAVATQMKIVDIVANVRKKEFSADDLMTLGLRWGIDFTYLGATKPIESFDLGLN